MIKQLYCWLFGHIICTDVFSGKYGKLWSNFYGREIDIPIVHAEQNEYCPRCGKVLINISDKGKR